MADKKFIKETLNLPQTSFSMKAKLAQREPEMLKKWDRMKLYQKIQEQRTKGAPFVLHDGPPYANGNIHLGTALNKILKDFIVKSKNLQGFQAPYVPGWDCHGLPIEIKVDQKIGTKKKDMSLIEFRERCKQYALKFVDIQRNQFKRLGVFGDWDHPYLTIDNDYESEVLKHLAAFFSSGNIYKGKKPVFWCNHCQTALAEAEIEYHDHSSPSIYVKFPVKTDLSKKFPKLKGKKVSVLIWTTTPWTLPANLAIAFHPQYEYSAFQVDNEVLITAKRMIPLISEDLGTQNPTVLYTFLGQEMEGMKAKHPFIDRDSVFVLADYVTLEQGTGCVHTAPGHGQEDYITGLKYKLDIYAPVDEKGDFTPEVKKYAGMNVFQANDPIMEDMEKTGHLIRTDDIVHSYPHCWRCKNPVIFRATDQWFISMDESGFRQKALKKVKKVRWIPPWGEGRIAKMIENRPDWCISRQRSWGVPIPAFTCKKCGTVLANKDITLHIADIFSELGANSWFQKSSKELLPPGTTCSSCGSTEFEKENNILDVWFESGASHNILGKKPELPWPADVYIEGHDQYRGWFNSSMLIGVAAKGKSPYKTCITHGFVLDEKGRGMSKSLGNIIKPEEIINTNGAEILRLWVAMLNFKEDAKYGKETRNRLVEAYRKIRNTWRFMLGNVYDFDPDSEEIETSDMMMYDRWILEKCNQLEQRVIKAYQDYEYHIVFHSMYNFFTVDLSSTYLDVIKDRLYCSNKRSKLRKSAQQTLFLLLKKTLILMSPILPFTTEEAWEALPDSKGKQPSVHLELFPKSEEKWIGTKAFAEWEKLGEIREKVLKKLENAREEKVIGNSLEAKVTLYATSSSLSLLKKYRSDLNGLFMVSFVDLKEGANEEIEVEAERVEWNKCDRCWNFTPDVGASQKYPEFCKRCEQVVRSLEK
ncbi:MAG: isoleucine--tRNA ligase [Candidatus Aminicenantes bacterium]|nr:isoleucine--tRNA ligase [Candidatus Aminicenantes bacterium]